MTYPQKNYSIPANMLHLMGMAWRYYKIVFFLILLQMVAGGLMPLFGLYLPVLAVDLLLAERGMREVLLILGGFAGAFALLQIIDAVAKQGKYPFQNMMRTVWQKLLFFKALDCDYRLMETAEGQTWYEKARKNFTYRDNGATQQMFNAMAGLVSGGISFVFLVGILAMLHPLVLVGLAVLAAAGYFTDKIPLEYEESQRDYTAALSKKHRYLTQAMGDVSAGKDMRIYNLSSLFTRLGKELMAAKFIVYTKIANRYFTASALQGVLGLARDGAAYAYCIWQVTQGYISVPEFILFMGAIGSFSGWLNELITHVLTLRRENTHVNDVRGFLESTNQDDPSQSLNIDILSGKAVEIEFCDVQFSYSRETSPVLDGVNFKIHAGEKAALVGTNGAGKTTIVKLLCGFYKADAGEILLNGHNINRFRRADLYTLFSAVFQDMCMLPLSVAENVGFTPPDRHDEKRLIQALKTAGIYEEIAAHPEGLQAYMNRNIKASGLVLSGGQQQKLMLARALYKDAPILILDEPTAALDPIAESEVYEGFHAVTQGKTALFISHRLASTRFCDRILMLSGGKITENGDHETLITQNGEYAHMYEVQSHYYKENPNENEVHYV
ncbi:MAG: ABC transporter ATP-binding protein/permease [Defluviitaleaceae bacterium]|nr:ABC transporter ATP-binding protein/permease [Defluviitaleaceae bacterium]